MQNIKRDPFEQAVGPDQKTAMSFGGALATPSSAFIYDFGALPVGQRLWQNHLMSFKDYPPLQAPETFNLEGIMKDVQKNSHPGD